MRIIKKCLALTLALTPTHGWGEQWSSGDGINGMKCVPLRRADAAKLWIVSGERQTAVEGSKESAVRRGDRNWPHLFFSVQFVVDRPIAKCMRVRWRVEPWGPNPVDAADFRGRFPSGTMDLFDDSDHDEVSGAIQLWVPDDHVRGRPETFRIVLLDPVTAAPLAGSIGIYDSRTGARTRHPAFQSLDMKNRMVMTVEDAPEQKDRR